ncbi:MAG TPA: hypothetical protein VEW07_03755 [Solirubrobacterales bacterium]|nr:hypothetical protein [Solirubrobacterales bacterium]
MSRTRRNPDLDTHARSEGRQMTTSGKKTTKLRRRIARAAVALTALGALVGVSAPAASAIEIKSLGASYTDIDGNPERQAGAHPDVRFIFRVLNAPNPENPELTYPVERPHRILTDLPVGLVGNPAVAEKCPEGLLKAALNGNAAACPVDSQVGIAEVYGALAGLPVYNIVVPTGSPAMFAFNVLGVVVKMTPTVRADDYGITIDSGTISQGLPIQGADVTLWGVPADPAHDAERYGPRFGGFIYEAPETTEAPLLPLLSTATSCPGTAESFTARVDGWKSIGLFDSGSFSSDLDDEPFISTGCDRLPFEPRIEARPTTNMADAPSGLDVKLTVPQNTDPDDLAAAHLKGASVTLPAGMTVNPSSANGLGACSPSQIGLTSPVGQAKAVFNGADAQCPNTSKLGTVEVNTPLIDHPLKGAIYLGEQNNNPFNSLLALYISVEDPQTGITIKLAGQPKPDPVSGQLTVDFANNPQLPFQELKVNMFTGPRAALKTPLACGQFTTTTSMTPWTSPYGANADPSDTFPITQGAGGGACLGADAQAPNKPAFSAGTVDPAAGAYSPFVMKLAREDGTAPIKAIEATLPKGLLGKLAGIPYCPDAALAAGAAKPGKAEQAAPSCPALSRVGAVTVGAGAGSNPLFVGGSAYLAGPYKGAPLSLAIITPATAGPFDLGTVVVRTALQVDPESTQIKAVSDPIPTILQGIPLDIRQIALNMDRPSFTLNPTSCDPTAITGSALSVFGSAAALTDRFQVGGCGALGFKPKLALSLRGGTARSQFPALKATLTARPGDANIAKAVVSLPHSEFLAQEHIRTICTRVQFAANACPAGSVYGKAKAWSPLLDQPLSGPVYLRSSSNDLPDLVADLNGQIRVSLVGRIDSIRGGIRNSFELVPDAPVSKFTLEMQGGKKGLLVNSRNLCKSVNKAQADFTAQNGKSVALEPVLTNGCKKKSRKAAGKNRG